MSFYTKNNKTIFFSHIPKTGGTSIDAYLCSGGYEKTFWGGYNDKTISLHHRQAKDEFLLNEKNKYNIIYQFTVVRDPIERFISEFFSRQSDYGYRSCEDFHLFVVRMIEYFEKNPSINDNHIRPQKDFIHDRMDVFKFGEWNNLINKLKSLDNDFPNHIIHMNHINNSLGCKTSTDHVKKLGWELKKETVDIIKNFYKIDYTSFNF